MIDPLLGFPNVLSELSASLIECHSLSAHASLSETPVASLFFKWPETEVNSHKMEISTEKNQTKHENMYKSYKKNHKLGERCKFDETIQYKS